MKEKVKVGKKKKGKKTAVSELPLAVIAHMPPLKKVDVPSYLEEVDIEALVEEEEKEG
ncbi:MAG: hypothetical protein H6656_22485 [Ardenticatenaceae bacterium]|nr:hypothetical protein [Ardenticatenaceae bacterium]